SCGPAPWTTIGVRPTSCRKASEDASASRSSRSTAPPTFTTAKRAASSCEKRLRYWLTSRVLAMDESSRTLVCRVCRSCWDGGMVMSGQPVSVGEDAGDGLGVALQLVQRDPLVGGVGLGDVARAVHQRGQAGRGEQRGLGPEVDRVADRQAKRVREVAGGQAPFLG